MSFMGNFIYKVIDNAVALSNVRNAYCIDNAEALSGTKVVS